MNTCDFCGKEIFEGTEVISEQDTYGDAQFCSKECCRAAEAAAAEIENECE